MMAGLVTEEYLKQCRKQLDDERKQLRKDSYNKKRQKSVHCTAKELQNVIRLVNEEFNLCHK